MTYIPESDGKCAYCGTLQCKNDCVFDELLGTWVHIDFATMPYQCVDCSWFWDAPKHAPEDDCPIKQEYPNECSCGAPCRYEQCVHCQGRSASEQSWR